MAVSKASRQKKAKRKTQGGDGAAAKRSARDILLEKMKEQPEYDKAIVLEEHPDVAKMSEVLLKFAEPLTEPLSEDDDKAFHNIIAVTVLCWNAALVSKPEREAMLHKFVSETAREDILPIEEFREILDFMVQRKNRLFKRNRRWILNYEIKTTKKEREVYVVSTLEPRHIKALLPEKDKPWWKRLFSSWRK